MDIGELEKILQILHEREITEFELEQEGVKLRIRRAGSNHGAPPAPAVVTQLVPALMTATGTAASTASPAPTASQPAPAATAPGAPAAPAAPSPEEEGLTSVKSPIVGTFYRSPDPNSPPFVNVGDRVRVGQVVCIIEAMKLMNEIEAEVAGEIVKTLADNGQPVQYGQPLFTIRPEK